MFDIPFCAKCFNAKTEPIEDSIGKRLVGCKELAQVEWDAGWYEDPEDSIVYQHNCPIMQEMKDEEN